VVGEVVGQLHLKNEKGQAMVEFALVLPILLLVFCGICEFGYIFSNQILVNNACREVARYAAVHYQDDGLTSVETQATTIVGNYSSNFSVAITTPESEQIQVDITMKVALITPFFEFLNDGNGCIDLNAECTMRME
jgi:Flp pilus assembly protein TadG